MPFASALSTAAHMIPALEEVCQRALAQLTTSPDLALLFFSPHHVKRAQELAAQAYRRLEPRCLLACPGEAIVGDDREIENGPALSLWLARWNQAVDLTPFHLTLEETSEGFDLLGWPDNLGNVDPQNDVILLLGDFFSFPEDDFLRQVNEEYPGLRVMGGIASAGRHAGDNPLLLGPNLIDQGAVGVLLQGPGKVRTVVSQGCRPIGKHMVVTKAQDNIIMELGSRPPLQQLQQLWEHLSPRDRKLVREGLHIGRVINEYQGEFQRGDFLLRNVIGFDKSSGAVAISELVRVGQTVQFHVRDAATADEDLNDLLQLEMSAGAQAPAGALLFTCNGRGTRLFGLPHHDARVVRHHTGSVPLAGFFALGELGPVGGQNFLHGFTASVVLFQE